MSKASDAANAVVNAVEQICNLYGVQSTREHSRVIMVPGAAGRTRPMFFGKWIDDNGTVHNSGRADVLARPRVIPFSLTGCQNSNTVNSLLAEAFRVTVPLWIECKSGDGRLSPDQRAFRAWVEGNGDYYLLIHDDARPLIEWFETHGVKKQPKRIIHAAEPMTTGDLYALPCRHCQKPRAEHIGAAFGCAGKRGGVWSPYMAAQ